MLWYIILPIVMTIVILVIVKVFGGNLTPQQEREKEAEEKSREKSERITKFHKAHPEVGRQIVKEWLDSEFDRRDITSEAQKKAFFEDFFKMADKPKDEQKQ